MATKVDLRPSSLARLDATVRHHVLPAFGHLPLAELGNAEVRAWVARMRSDGLSASSVRKAHFALHQMMSAAVADRRLAYDPTHDVPLPAEQHGEPRFLSTEEVGTLADAIAPHLRALVLVAAYGGLRFGELAALRRRRIDLLRGRVQVAENLVDLGGTLSFGEPKTKNGRRTVPLPRRVVSELGAHLATYTGPEADALVFRSTTGQPLRRAGFRRDWWLPAVAAAGLDGLRFHDLRHTFVSLWVAAGAHAKEVSVRAGHSSVAFTLDRYGHLYEDADDRLSDRLDALLDAAQPPREGAVVGLRGPR
jgi:integrase